jgi:2-phosphoglycerate kinase
MVDDGENGSGSPKVEPEMEEWTGRLMIEQPGGGRRPFMRGIMVHSLMARGVSFEDAYRVADAIRDRIRDEGVVRRGDLASMISEVLGEEFDHQPPIPIPITMRVASRGRSSPFSKGTLAQSLLAASVEPDDAFDVAREIELKLLRQGQKEITRRNLRRLAYETLLHRLGSKTAERYLVWRQYQEPERPVIILLGGTTGVGKTSLALEVARRLGISRVLSTDSIRQVMRIMLSPDLMPAIHASSFDAHHHIPIRSTDTHPVVEGFMTQVSVVSVGVRAILDRAVEENTSLVLDGVTLVPGLIDLASYADRAHVFFLVVARLDEDALRSHFAARAEREQKREAGRYLEHMQEILRIQEHLLELADRFDVPIVDNVTLEGSVLLVMRHVVESLRKSSKADIESLL